MIYFYYVILGIVLLVLCVITFYTCSLLVGLIRAKGVPYVPLSKKQLAFLNENIKLNENDKDIDFGSGDGRVLRMFEKQGVKYLTGYDVNLWAILLGKIKNKITNSKVNLQHKNFKSLNIGEFNKVFCYLLEGQLSKLQNKFEAELKPGAEVICFSFEVKGWKRLKVITNGKHRIFVYTI